MMKTAYMITGPESSGNKAVTQLFCKAGCYGSWTEPQHLNHFVEFRQRTASAICGQSTLIAYRTSIPGGPIYRPDLIKIRDRFLSDGWNLKWIFLLRDPFFCARSKVLRGHQPDFRTALHEFFSEFTYLMALYPALQPAYPLSTSYLFTHTGRAIQGLSIFSGLHFPPSATKIIKDSDAKH